MEDVEKMLYKLAHSFHNTTGIALEELINQCRYAYVLARNSYDRTINKAKFSTYLYRVVENELIKFTTKELKYNSNKVDLDDAFTEIVTTTSNIKDVDLTKFPQDVQQLIELIFKHLDDLDFSKSQRWNKSQILYFMEKDLKWGQRKRKAAVRKLKDILASTPENELF